MPIKPENRKLYPPNWKALSLEVREEAGNKCEWCKIPNHRWGWRDPKTKEFYMGVPPKGVKGFMVVLTVAHLDQNPRNNKRSNLRALCQKHHLAHDAKYRKEAREKKIRGSGIHELWVDKRGHRVDPGSIV